jgi:hypothetical protein
MLPGQLSFFDLLDSGKAEQSTASSPSVTTTKASSSLSPSSSPSSPLVGLHVITPKPCACTAIDAVIGSSCGPHHHQLRCTVCRRHRGWLVAFIDRVVNTFGAPTTPIILRMSKNPSR